eukprot:COSAG01_NODE_2377_length_7801_cov_4.201117_8_plen_156_part_00
MWRVACGVWRRVAVAVVAVVGSYVSGPEAKEALRLSGCGDGLGWRVVAVEGATVESGASAMAAMGAAAAQIRCACPAGGVAAGGQASVDWISQTAPRFPGKTSATTHDERALAGGPGSTRSGATALALAALCCSRWCRRRACEPGVSILEAVHFD